MPRASWAMVRAGFRRYATYRQATIAGTVTNTVFGFLRCYILLSVAAAAGGTLRGYDAEQLVTYVWVGQGMLAAVSFWTPLDIAERVRTGDVVTDLFRPVNPMWTYLCTDLGRVGFALLIRFTAPFAAGLVFFEMYLPQRPHTYLLAAVSLVAAAFVGFAGRYLVGLSAFWLMDTRGAMAAWGVLATVGSGLYFPLAVLPEWLRVVLWVGTPFPSLLQATADIVVARGDAALILGGQIAWAIGLLALCGLVQRRATGRLVVQGG
ncbi:ABC transporter permease [Actinokineospora guangxiensis]|uniref:ABC transporter permease n=1 Tax=Actinokineospora guangxiensis TaxID=1490288 RepID=A0ABW0EN44_9PSEU